MSPRTKSSRKNEQKMLNICCVLKTGGIYKAEHVERLIEQVKPWLQQPYQFVCFSDLKNLPCERIPLINDWPGWWSKLELWRPGALQGRVLYFDLDVTITGNLDDLADYPKPFAICKDWGRFGYNSSVIAWDAGEADNIYTGFIKSPQQIMNKFRGDQDFMNIKKTDAAIFPRGWCYSYRLGKKTGYPDDMRVCVYHGHPKPWLFE